MSFEEIYDIAKLFVDLGVTKIRLTGGEPLVRRDVEVVLKKLATLPVDLTMTTNAVLVDRYMDVLNDCGITKLNISLDTLDPKKFKNITRRDNFEKVYNNIHLLIENGFEIKINAVLIKGFNDSEIIDFVEFTKSLDVSMRFIEFMPFDGNEWDKSKLVSYDEVMEQVNSAFDNSKVIRLKDALNDTSKNYKIEGYKGSFAIISSVTNPFCDSCNRIRLTADGKIKNCLFSNSETDLLTPFRAGENIEPLIEFAISKKLKVRGGMDTREKLESPELHTKNRSMISIGG
jgi:cyclic pyranopterin phosphate synthase